MQRVGEANLLSASLNRRARWGQLDPEELAARIRENGRCTVSAGGAKKLKGTPLIVGLPDSDSELSGKDSSDDSDVDFVFGEDELTKQEVVIKKHKSYFPNFSAGLPYSELEKLMDHTVTREVLRTKGYPEYTIYRLMSMLGSGKRLNPFAKTFVPKEIVVEEENNRVVSASYRQYQKGEMGEFWFPPVRAMMTMVPKPTEYDLFTFRRWLFGVVARLAIATHGKPHLKVTANASARVLYHGGSFSQKEARSLLALASAQVTDFSKRAMALRTNTEFRKLHIGEFHPALQLSSLTLHGVVYTKLRDWNETQELLQKNKPLYLLGVKFFEGQKSVDRNRLQAMLDEKYPCILESEGQTLSSMKAKVPSWEDTKAALTPPALHLIHDHKIVWPKFDEIVADMGLLSIGTNRNAARVVSFVIGVARATDSVGVAAAFGALIAGHDKLWAMSAKFVERVTAGFDRFEGVGDFISTLVPDAFKEFVACTIGVLTNFLMVEIVTPAAGAIGPIFVELAKAVKFGLLKQTAEGVAKAIVDFVKEYLTRIRSAITLRSLSPLWAPKQDPIRFINEVNSVIEYRQLLVACGQMTPQSLKAFNTMREEGKIPDDWATPVSQGEFAQRLTEYVRRGEELVVMFSASPAIHRDLKTLVERLKRYSADVDVSISSQYARVVPYMIYWFGAPGVGKSVLSQAVVKAIGKKNSLPDDACYMWQNGVNFQDGLKGHHWAITMDDVDQNPSAATQGVIGHVESVNRIVNNAPLPIEQAGVDEKGRVYGRPLLLQYASNFIDGRASSYSLCPETFERRINVHVEVSIKPKYAGKDGKLDVEKVLLANTHDVYVLKVKNFKEMKKRGVTKVHDDCEKGEEMSFPKFMVFLHKEFENHLAQQMKILGAQDPNVGFCNQCYLPKGRECGCVTPELEEKEEEIVIDAKKEHQQFHYEGKCCGIGKADDDDEEEIFKPTTNWFTVVRKSSSTAEGKAVVAAETLEEEQTPAYQWLKTEMTAALRLKESPAFSEASQDARDLIDLELEEMGKVKTFLDKHPKMTRRDIQSLFDVRAPRLLVFDQERWAGDFKVLLAALAAAGVSAAGMFAVYKFVSTVVTNELQGREANVNPGYLPVDWARAEQKYVPGVPKTTNTFTLQEILDVSESAKCWVEGPKFAMWGSVLCASSLLVPSHVAERGEFISVTHGGRTHRFQLTCFNCELSKHNRELWIVTCGELKGVPGVLGKMNLVFDDHVTQFDEVYILEGNVVRFKDSKCLVKRMEAGKCLLTGIGETQAGDCGLLYVVRHGSRWSVAGMHFQSRLLATITGSRREACGAMVCRSEVEATLKTLLTSLKGVVVAEGTFVKTGEIDTVMMPYQSQVWAAMSHLDAEPYPLGQLNPPMIGATMKTKVKQSLIASKFRELEAEVCGTSPYWLLPVFRGAMVDYEEKSVWMSPYTNAFRAQNRSVTDSRLIRLALLDYLSGMRELDPQGYAQLSENQACVGVVGTPINAINMKTSVGPPHNRSKEGYLARDADGVMCAMPAIWEMVDELKEIVSQGYAPASMGACIPKDEAVKPGKIPRIFTNLPFATNLLLKQKLAPLILLMRANWQFFESAVGINMTSLENGRLIAHLKEVNPELTCLGDGDLTMMDKAWKGELWDAVIVVFKEMANFLGYDIEEVDAYLVGLKHTVCVMKSDLFQSFWNPSGNFVTVELNGLCLSIAYRMVWYDEVGSTFTDEELLSLSKGLEEGKGVPRHPKFTFRTNNRLIHYGDDNIISRREEYPFPTDFSARWKRVTGFKMTNGKKDDVFIAMPLSEIRFLKRAFVWNEELQAYEPPLEKASIVRMLVIKKDTSLTERDHASVVMTEALKECAYHPREFFERMRELCSETAVEFQLEGNPYLKLGTWEEYLEQKKTGSFSTWSTRPAPPEQEMFGEHFEFDGIMSNVTLVENHNVGSAAMQPVVLETTTFPEPMGEVAAKPAPTIGTQKLQENDLGDFLQRGVLVTTIPFAPTDTPISVLSQIDPLAMFFANPAVADKVRNFRFWRGTYQIVAKVAVPALCFGRYVFTAVPNGARPGAIAETLYVENCKQTEFHVEVDMAQSNDFVFQLPFVFPAEYAQLPGAGQWKLWTTCLQPIATSIGGGVATGQVSIFVNFMPDLELVVPIYQGVEANDAIKRHAPNLHKKLTESKLSATAGKVKDVAGMLSKVPLIGPFATTVQAGAALAEGVFSMFGFTRPRAETVPIATTQRSVTNVARCDGNDSSDVAALSVGNGISIDPLLSWGNPEDELSNASMFNRWTMVKVFTLGVGQSGVVGSIPVSPSYCRAASSGSLLHPTTAGYYGLPFEYWAGDMEYLVQVPVGSTHRGTMQIAWGPPGVTLTGDLTNTTLNTIFDLEQGSDKIIQVGYSREVGLVRNHVITDSLPIIPTGSTNGELIFKMLNPLTAQSDLASTRIFVFARCKNMEFMLPRTTFPYLGVDPLGAPYHYSIDDQITLEGKGVLADDGIMVEEIALVASGKCSSLKDVYSGEDQAQIRALMQKPSKIGPFQFDAEPRGFNHALWYPRSNTTKFTWAGYFSALFVGVASSTRFKLLPDVDVWAGVTPWVQFQQSEPKHIGTLAPMTYTGANKGAEFETPYYFNEKWISTRSNANYSDPSAVRQDLIHIQPGDPEVFPNVMLYVSLGPDVRVSLFRQVPAIRLTLTVPPEPDWF